MVGDPLLSEASGKRKPSSISRKSGNKARRINEGSSTSEGRQDEKISEESITEGESDEEAAGEKIDEVGEELSSEEEFAQESAADRRRRLAKQYLENLKSSAQETEDFDAKDLDDDIISRRLQRDVAEEKGKVFKFIGTKISSQVDDVEKVSTRIGSRSLTDLSINFPNLYTVSKDCELIKWNVASRRPKRIKHTKGGIRYFELLRNQNHNHHYEAINCVAASPNGRYVVTGGNDSRLIIWSSENLACLRVLDTRAPVNAIVFRRDSDELFAACGDRRVRTFSINQFTQLEILYGHQENITDISALSRETCVSVGSRDRTAMFWKIVEESRLSFRGESLDSITRKNKDKEKNGEEPLFIAEGSIDRVCMVDESHFVTGSDNGNIALWSLSKKKALCTVRSGHGLKPKLKASSSSAECSEEKASKQIPINQPYWITAVHVVPYSDFFVTGSYNGTLNLWKISHEGMRSFDMIGQIKDIRGCVTGIESVILEEKKLIIFALLSKEHRLGRWLGKTEGARNALVTVTFDI